jgi:hypothetical protein
LTEAIACFDAIYSKDYPHGSREATLRQIMTAHEHYDNLAKTGEITLAKKEGNQIVFLMTKRQKNNTKSGENYF